MGHRRLPGGRGQLGIWQLLPFDTPDTYILDPGQLRAGAGRDWAWAELLEAAQGLPQQLPEPACGCPGAHAAATSPRPAWGSFSGSRLSTRDEVAPPSTLCALWCLGGARAALAGRRLLRWAQQRQLPPAQPVAHVRRASSWQRAHAGACGCRQVFQPSWQRHSAGGGAVSASTRPCWSTQALHPPADCMQPLPVCRLLWCSARRACRSQTAGVPAACGACQRALRARGIRGEGEDTHADVQSARLAGADVIPCPCLVAGPWGACRRPLGARGFKI